MSAGVKSLICFSVLLSLSLVSFESAAQVNPAVQALQPFESVMNSSCFTDSSPKVAKLRNCLQSVFKEFKGCLAGAVAPARPKNQAPGTPLKINRLAACELDPSPDVRNNCFNTSLMPDFFSIENPPHTVSEYDFHVAGCVREYIRGRLTNPTAPPSRQVWTEGIEEKCKIKFQDLNQILTPIERLRIEPWLFFWEESSVARVLSGGLCRNSPAPVGVEKQRADLAQGICYQSQIEALERPAKRSLAKAIEKLPVEMKQCFNRPAPSPVLPKAQQNPGTH